MAYDIIHPDHLYELLSLVAGESITRHNIDDPRTMRRIFAHWGAVLGAKTQTSVNYRSAGRILVLQDEIQRTRLSLLSRVSLSWQSPRAKRFRMVSIAYLLGALFIASIISMLMLMHRWAGDVISQRYEPCDDQIARWQSSQAQQMLAYPNQLMPIPEPHIDESWIRSDLCIRGQEWSDILSEHRATWKVLVFVAIILAMKPPVVSPRMRRTAEMLFRDYGVSAVSEFASDIYTALRNPYADWPSRLLPHKQQRRFHAFDPYTIETEIQSYRSAMGISSWTRAPDASAVSQLTVAFLALVCQYEQDRRCVSRDAVATLSTVGASSSESLPGEDTQPTLIPESSSGEDTPPEPTPHMDFMCIYRSLSELLGMAQAPTASPPRAVLSFAPNHVQFFRQQFTKSTTPQSSDIAIHVMKL